MVKKALPSKSTKSTLKTTEKKVIKFVRISTGEDLVSEMKIVRSEHIGDHYVLISPLKVIYALLEKPGMVSLNLISWIFPKITERQEFIIYPKDIITMADPTAGVKKYYNEMVMESKFSASIGGSSDFAAFDDDNEEDEEDEHIRQIMDELKSVKRKYH